MLKAELLEGVQGTAFAFVYPVPEEIGCENRARVCAWSLAHGSPAPPSSSGVGRRSRGVPVFTDRAARASLLAFASRKASVFDPISKMPAILQTLLFEDRDALRGGASPLS